MTADFTQIRDDIKDWLSNQSKFSDYNFSGSAMSVVLDILAYNAMYLNINANMTLSETFLDTANQRGSVVSRAKSLGYLPRSRKAASAEIRLSFAVTGNPIQYILPKNTRFNSTINGNNYTFVTTEDIIFDNVANVFTKTITVSQGVLTNYQYIVNTNLASQRFTIPDQKVDLSLLSISKKETVNDADFLPMIYFNDLGLGNVDADSEVFFLKEEFDGFYDTYYGDGVLGKGMVNGNVIKLDYLITDGIEANGAKLFSIASTLPNVTALTITTISAAQGGSDRETIDSIKFLAPLFYQSQNRAVTEDDYTVLVKNGYGNIDDIKVWGGEKNQPPFYGRVFMAIKPMGNTRLTNTQKQQIVNDYLSKYNIVGVIPEIVDPNYIYVSVNTNVTYNSRLFSRTTNLTLENDVETAIVSFFEETVNKFGNPLYYSKLVKRIDDVSPIIKQNITNLTLRREVRLIPSLPTQYKFNFNNAISPNSVRSNEIVINGANYFIKDIPDGTAPFTTGTMAVYAMNGGNVIYLNKNAGTVNYNTGEVVFANLMISDITSDPINKLFSITVSQGNFVDVQNPEIVTTDYNVYGNNRDDIIVLEDVTITITADNS